MRIAFFGTPEFAVPTLNRLITSSHDVIAVVTQPDRRRGRGQRVSASPVKQLADAHRLRVLQPDRVRDEAFIAQLTDLQPDIGVVAAYGKILPEALLSLPPFGMVNVHASLLPKYRGAAPIHRAIMAGESETGVTIIQLVLEMDAGPMLSWARHPIEPNETSARVDRALAALGADLLLAAIGDIEAGRSVRHPQDHERATLAPRLSRDDGIINWDEPAVTVHDQVRGLHPWPHAFTYLDGSRFLVLRTTVIPCPEHLRRARQCAGGTILEAVKDRLIVATGAERARAVDDDGTVLAIHELQAEGRKPMPTRAFLTGHPLMPGSVLRRDSA